MRFHYLDPLRRARKWTERAHGSALRRRLILTHLSSRHDTEPAPLLAQAREEYKGQVEIAHDGLTVEIAVRD